MSCKAGGNEEMYKRDRAECADQMVRTIGNRYSQPGWWGWGGMIVATVQGEVNRSNLERAQVNYMRVCLEGKNWTVQLKRVQAASLNQRSLQAHQILNRW